MIFSKEKSNLVDANGFKNLCQQMDACLSDIKKFPFDKFQGLVGAEKNWKRCQENRENYTEMRLG